MAHRTASLKSCRSASDPLPANAHCGAAGAASSAWVPAGPVGDPDGVPGSSLAKAQLSHAEEIFKNFTQESWFENIRHGFQLFAQEQFNSSFP